MIIEMIGSVLVFEWLPPTLTDKARSAEMIADGG
jgi:hypothetical protein